MKSGRKTIADLVVCLPGGKQMPPAPPATLTAEQQKIWADTVGNLPPDWILPSAFPLLTEYVRRVARAERLEDDISAFESAWLEIDGGVEKLNSLMVAADREGRAVFAAARQLRLTPASVTRRENARTVLDNHRPWPLPWGTKSGRKR